VSPGNPGLAIDLHTHSNLSDGSLTPGELLRRAAAAGVQVLALTDHDTIDGLDEAERAAAQTGIRLIAGAEISACWRAQGIHVLGLWIDPACGRLRQRLESQAERRRVRMRKICARLGQLGLPGGELLAAVEAQPGVPTRAHLAAALLAGGHVSRTDEAFRRYLGKGRAAHLAADWPALAEVVAWIRAAGGVASLAHPARYDLSAGARRKLLGDFVTAGGGALEVVTGGNGSQHIESSARLAVQFGLAGSVGSDFHNPNQVWNPLGRLAKLPDCVTPVWHARGL
jgi:predicted metal-dependent phosphoesterase TrpH